MTAVILNIVLSALLVAAALALVNIYHQRIKAAKHLANWFTENDKDFPLTELPVSVDGIKFYTFSNPIQIPARRALAAEAATKQAEMNVTSEDLNAFITEAVSYGNKGEISKIFYLLERLKERLDWACEYETLMKLATCYFLIEGEPIQSVSNEFTKRKRALIQSSPEAEGFFLAAAYKLTTEYSDFSETDILQYLAMKSTKEGGRGLSLKRPTSSTPASI